MMKQKLLFYLNNKLNLNPVLKQTHETISNRTDDIVCNLEKPRNFWQTLGGLSCPNHHTVQTLRLVIITCFPSSRNIWVTNASGATMKHKKRWSTSSKIGAPSTKMHRNRTKFHNFFFLLFIINWLKCRTYRYLYSKTIRKGKATANDNMILASKYDSRTD